MAAFITTSKKFIFITLVTMTLGGWGSGCASSPKTRASEPAEATATQAPQPGAESEQYGPLAPAEQPLGYGPEPAELKPITLVLGPGMAEGFAHVGAIRALVENKIPIRAIYGMEMGSLIASLYAMESNINYFEWSLFRFSDDIFLSRPNVLGRLFGANETQGDSDRLRAALEQVFGQKTIADAKIPLRISLQKKQSAMPALLDQGALIPALRASIAGPGFFGPGTYDGQPAEASSDLNGEIFLCSEARAQSGSPVVLIDTSPHGGDPSSADLVIRPELRGVAPNDFAKKTEIALEGKKAVEDKLPELRRWVGIPDGATGGGVP